ncbi:MAG: hypothetical protein OEZ43_07635 [Gammaproteobacteria bacterium]|nr:hypothetical protein [Gammaproteobacteria bacterium]
MSEKEMIFLFLISLCVMAYSHLPGEPTTPVLASAVAIQDGNTSQ